MLAPTPRILALSPPAAVRAPRISVAKRIVGAELSLSFPLPRRTAPFLYPGQLCIHSLLGDALAVVFSAAAAVVSEGREACPKGRRGVRACYRDEGWMVP